MSTEPRDLQDVRTRLHEARGPRFWRAFEELADSAPVQDFLKSEFPSLKEQFEPGAGGTTRRNFLRLMGASLSLGGLGACTRQPSEKIYAYSKTPESTIPGRPRFYATALPTPNGALGVLVESHDGRPTKIEGNPDHPASRGATDACAQAEVLGLYDPDRSRSELRAGQISTWEAYLEELEPELARLEETQGEGLAVLSEPVRSPTLAAQRKALQERFPKMRWHTWQPFGRDNERKGALFAYHRDVIVDPDLTRARVVVSLNADFLSGADGVRLARDLASARRAREGGPTPCRLYAAEGALTPTGAFADHRLRIRPSRVTRLVYGLAQWLGLIEGQAEMTEEERAFVAAVVEDARAHPGEVAVLVGEAVPPRAHLLVHLVNERLGAYGKTLHLRESAEDESQDGAAAMNSLAADLEAGKVRALFILGGNPLFTAPAQLGLAEKVRKAPFRVHLSDHEDETSRQCLWHIPQAHVLETWSDVRAKDGTATILQPLIEPLYDGIGIHVFVAALLGDATGKARDHVRATWRARRADLGDEEFEVFWRRSVHDGLVEGTRNPSLELEVTYAGAPTRPDFNGLELTILPGAWMRDGRHANNGWLQELPQPISRLTWGNAVHVSPATAEELGVKTGDVLRVTKKDFSVEVPAWVQPGQADSVLVLHAGYGRRTCGRVGEGVGVDAFPLTSLGFPWDAGKVEVERTGRTERLATVQDHSSMEGRDIVRVLPFERFAKKKAGGHGDGDDHAHGDHGPGHGDGHGDDHGHGHGHHDPNELSLYPEHEYEGHAWGMVIDQSACIGCNACMIACQAENNVPVVGKDEVLNGREMHWLRIDRYYEGDPAAPAVHHQPVPCMHCERAPCEVVCPVAATVHGDEGLNEMVYNRCVGTRYCANNCPYKVRRFNFYLYSDFETEVLKLGRNPDVTVRSRGVMEKCTYCVQRINQGRIAAKRDGQTLKDGDVVTACQAVCPTEAIVFGDLNDAGSQVAKLRKEPHHYALLEELGTKPRTTYLAKVTHPNPDLRGD